MSADLRFALRQLVKSPGFSVIAVVTLALGIGITTVAFTWIRAVLFTRLTGDEPDRIVFVWSASPARSIQRTATSTADFVEWRDASRSVALAAAARVSYNLATDEAPAIRAAALQVSPSF